MNAPRSTVAHFALFALAAAFFVLGSRSARAAAEADLLVAYDQSYTASAGGHANVQVLAANAIAGSNAINERCGTGARVRIVGYYEAAQYSYQRTSKGGFVGWMANYDSRLSDVVDAGNARGADLVTFLCVSTSDGAAAVAQQPGRYSAFDPGQFWSTVVAHELAGHNYSCDHRGGRLEPKTVMMHNYCGGGAQGYYSNPNIWLNGVRLVGEGSCLGDAVNGGDNSYLISTTAQGVADRNSRVVAAPNLANVVRRWSFKQAAGAAPAGTTFVDSVSGSALATVQGSGAVFTGSGIRLPGGAAGGGAAYLQLPAGVVSAYANVTIEIWATPLSFQTWGRLLDFNNGTSAYLTLSTATGSSLATQRFESVVGGATVTLDSGIPTTAGVPHHYAITYLSNGSGGGRWTWYRDGDAVSWLDVAYPLSSLPDVNNWLGRSAFAADALANCEYAEVRISNVALTRDQVLANFALGPNRQASDVYLTGDDPLGQASFNSAGLWADGLAPSAAKTYETANFRLRTPADSVSRTFAGQSLKISGGSLTWKGTTSATLTVNDLKLAGAPELIHAGSGTWTLAGNLSVDTDGAMLRAANGPVLLSANLTGASSLLLVNNTVTLGGANSAFAGKILVGDGRASALAIDAESRLGPNPPALVTDQLTLNRGTIQTAGALAIDDANRGILLDVNGGTFNVTSGGTLTLGSPLYTRDLGSSVVAGALAKAGAGTLVLDSPGSTFKGTLYVDSGSTSADDGIVRVANNQVLAAAHGPIYINNNTSGSSRLQLDGTSGAIALPSVSLAGRNGAVPAIHSLIGANSIAGITLNAGGSNYVVQSDAGTLTVSAAVTSAATGSRNVTFQGSGNISVTGAISDGAADAVGVVKLGAGTLALTGACTHDGATTLSGGALRLDGSLTTAGALTTAAGTTLLGTGSTNAATTINGVHTPGTAANSTGAQTFTGTLAYGSTARLNWNLVNNATDAASFNRIVAQSVTVAGGAAINLTLNGPGSTVDFTNAFWTQIRVWPLLGATALTGQFSLGAVGLDSAGRSISAFGSLHLQQSTSGVSVVFYPLGATPPSAPTGLSSTASPGAVSLAWTSASGAVSYTVRRSTSSGGPYDTVATDVASTNFTDNSVVNGTTYYYVVVSANAFGESDASGETVATPRAPSVVDKADNTLALNQAASWAGSASPTAWDTVRWSGLAGANTASLGANLSFNGLAVGATGGSVGIGAGNTLTLGPGGINMAAATQNLSIASGLALGAGQQSWTIATGRVFSLSGALSRAAGSVLLLDKSSSAGTATSSAVANVNGIVGPWAIVKSAGAAANNSSAGHTYATKDGASNLVAYTGATSLTLTTAWGGMPSGGAGTVNYDLNSGGDLGTFGILRSFNTLRYTGAGARQMGNTGGDILALNGLMNAGTGAFTLGRNGANITNDYSFGILIGANNELVLAPMTADLVFYSFIKNGSGGAGSVTIAGNAAVVLAGANTFTGGLQLDSGSLQLAIDNAIGTGPLRINGGDIRASGAARTLTNAATLNGSFSLGRNTTFGGPITLANDVMVTSANPDAQTAATSAFTGAISGSRGISFADGANPTGTTILSGANTHSGGTTLQSGALQLGHATALGAATGNLVVNGGSLNLNGFSPTIGRLSGSGGVIANLAAGIATLTTNSTADSTFAGSLQNGASGQVLALTKLGSGTLTLSGVNTYTGATTVSAGGIRVSGSLSGGGAVSVASGAVLSGNGTIQGPVNLAAGAIHAPGNPTGAQTVAGALAYANGARLRWTLPANADATGSSSRVSAGVVNVAAGAVIDLVFNSPGSVVNFTDVFWTQPRTWTVLTASNKTGDFALGAITVDSAGRALADYGVVALQQNATSVTVTFTPTASALNLWRFQQFGVYVDTPEVLAGDNEDYDGDGIPNLLEYAFGTDPKVANPLSVTISRTGNVLVLSYPRRSPADTSLVYDVQGADDLATGFGTATGVTDTAGLISTYTDNVDLSVPGIRRFLRVSVSYSAP